MHSLLDTSYRIPVNAIISTDPFYEAMDALNLVFYCGRIFIVPVTLGFTFLFKNEITDLMFLAVHTILEAVFGFRQPQLVVSVIIFVLVTVASIAGIGSIYLLFLLSCSALLYTNSTRRWIRRSLYVLT